MTNIAAAIAAFALTFVTHASFFSSETRQPVPIDPQVFEQDANAPAATGPQGIHHAAGLRPALLSDPKDTPLYNADGAALSFTLGQWLGAKGTAQVTGTGGGAETVTIRFQGLIPQGSYSLFENHFDQQPVGFTPLDSSGTTNSFIAGKDGGATLDITVTPTMTHDNAILLVYHSDHQTHGMMRGTIGVNAHHQLIARIP